MPMQRDKSRGFGAPARISATAANTRLPRSQVPAPSYDSYYLGAGLNRPIGRNALLSFGYTAYIVNTNQAACGITVCTAGGYSTQHQLAVGYQWHTRPFFLR